MSSVNHKSRWALCILLAVLLAGWMSGGARAEEDAAAFLATMDNASATLRYPAWTNAAKYGPQVIVPLGERYEAGDRSKRQDLRRAIEEIVHNAGRPGADAERKAVSAELLKLISAERPAVLKNEILDLLGLIADSSAIPAIEPLFRDAAVREEAARCIERIPGKEATDFFANNLTKVPADCVPRMLAALGHRKDPGAGPAIETFINGTQDKALGLAGLEALSKCGALPPKGMKKILDSLGDVDKDVKANIRLRFADNCLAQNNKGRAARIYDSLVKGDVGEQIKLAAEEGLKKTGPPPPAKNRPR